MATKKKSSKKVEVKKLVKRKTKQPAPGSTKVKAKSTAKPRPKVTADEKLYLLFKEDYHARQLFEYLRVQTVGELERFTSKQIFDILAKPVRDTVRRIRETLADKHRCLAEDEEFLREYIQWSLRE